MALTFALLSPVSFRLHWYLNNYYRVPVSIVYSFSL